MTEKKVRVLLAEGESGEAAAALRALFPEETGGLELTVVSTLSTLIPTVEVVNPEIILLDLALAHPDPTDFVRHVHRAVPAVPLIVFADPGERECAVQCLSAGALDYFLKGSINARTVERAFRTALEHNTLGGLADLLRDPLTKLYIRDGFLTLGSRAMGLAMRNDSTLVLLCMRVENLATLRAQYGLSAMEHALQEVAALLQGNFRRTDIVARIGESQFAALAVDAVEPSAPILRQRLERRIAALNRHSGPWGPLKLRMNARFWSSKDASTFSEFLDAVEEGLRGDVTVPAEEPVLGDSMPRR